MGEDFALNGRHRPYCVTGATVIDGTGSDPFVADVVVDAAGSISSIGPGAARRAPEGADVVDGEGLVLAPGFVDLHSHSDLYTLLRQPGSLAPVGDSPKLVQGCTAQVFGQDGISAAPVSDDDLEGHRAFLAGLDGTLPPEMWTWRSFAGYLAAVRAASATRTAVLAGHSTIRRLVMGDEAREAGPDDIAAMQEALARSFDEGAAGFSTGLVYIPAAFSTTSELEALCEVVAAHGRPFFVHVRSESDLVLEATDEVLGVAERTGCHLHYSHIKVAGRRNWQKAAALIDRVSAARSSGVGVTADVHPYIAGSTSAIVLLPPWVQDGGVDAAVARLGDADVRARIRRDLTEDTTSFDNWWAFSDGWHGLRVAGARRKDLVGLALSEVIEAAGEHDPHSQAAFDVIFDLLASERLGMSLVSFNNVEENVARFLSLPFTSIGTDAVLALGGHPHPRLHGTFPRVLGRFVRELSTVSLVEAIEKMTSRAAAVVGWAGRIGELRAGLPADMVLFDPERIEDRATFESPWEHPVGIEGVWVGGCRLVSGGTVVGDVVAGEPPTPRGG